MSYKVRIAGVMAGDHGTALFGQVVELPLKQARQIISNHHGELVTDDNGVPLTPLPPETDEEVAQRKRDAEDLAEKVLKSSDGPKPKMPPVNEWGTEGEQRALDESKAKAKAKV